MNISEAPSCGITDDRHVYDSRGIIWDHNILALLQKFCSFLATLSSFQGQNAYTNYISRPIQNPLILISIYLLRI
jgi:hypothetical protein